MREWGNEKNKFNEKLLNKNLFESGNNLSCKQKYLMRKKKRSDNLIT